MADIASDYLFLNEFLSPVLLCAVVVILVYYRSTTVVSQLRGGHRWPLQVATNVFDVTPGSPGLFGEMDFPVTLILGFQVTPPLFIVPDMTKTGQAAGVNPVVASAQQPGDGNPPDMLHLFLFEEQGAPDTVLNIEAATCDRQVDMGMLPELAAIGVQGAENADFDAHFAGKAEHGPGGTVKQVIKQRPVVVEKRPEHMGHGKGDVLPVAVGQDVLLCCNPLLSGFESA